MIFNSRFEYYKFKYKIPSGIPNRKPYNISLPIADNYNKAKHKIMVVIGHVHSLDLIAGRLLGDVDIRTLCTNTMKLAFSEAQKIDPQLKEKDIGFCVVNFNYFKTYDLSDTAYDTSLAEKKKRVIELADQHKPNTILVVGDEAMLTLSGDEYHKYTRGCIRKVKLGGTKYNMVSTVPIDNILSEQDGEGYKKKNKQDAYSIDLDEEHVTMANLIGYSARCMVPALLGHNPYDLSYLKPNYEYIDTIKKAKRVFKKLNKAKAIALDTETKGLDVIDNAILTFQFSVDDKVSYIIPYKHKDNPWDKKEFELVTKMLSKFFSKKEMLSTFDKTRYLIGQNLSFDLRLVRQELGIPYIYWPIWDTMAGEYSLDENMKGLNKHGNKPYRLDEILARYNNLFYQTAPFGKKQRDTISDVKLDREVLEYCAMDSVCAYAIHVQQQLRASKQTIGTENEKVYLKAYQRLMLGTLSPLVKTLSIMMQRGVTLDIVYLLSMMKKDSPLNAKIVDLHKKLYEMTSTIKANKILQKNSGIMVKPLFGSSTGQWVFDLSKKAHKQVLYFDVLGLKPVSQTKDGKGGKLDKQFKEKYKEIPEVAILLELDKLAKLKSSYITAFYKHAKNSPDTKHDRRLRAGYGYADIVTGRLNSFKPSFQQIPEHGDNAKLVKRVFITPFGFLGIEVDYSAHEVRCGGLISRDITLLNGFRKIHNIIVKYRKNPTKENLEKKVVQGDSHKMSYSSFTGMKIKKWLKLNLTEEGQKKAKALRQIAKGIIFGAFYGIGVNSLSTQIGKTKEETEKILKDFFKKFSGLDRWLSWTREHSKAHNYTFSPLGRKRNLFGYVSGIARIVGAMERRAQNSPVQGAGSDIAVMAADLYAMHMTELLQELGDDEALRSWKPIGPNAMVHDSVKTEAPFKYVFLSVHLLEWCLTTGVQEYIERVFGMKFDAPLGVDFDICASWSIKKGWTFAPEELFEITRSMLIEHYKIHGQELSEKASHKLLKEMKAQWESQQKTLKIHKRFPLNYKIYEDLAA